MIFTVVNLHESWPTVAPTEYGTCSVPKAKCRRARLKRDGTRAETRFGLSAKRTSPFKSAGASVQSTTGSRGVRISGSNGSNAGYTMFWGRVQDFWLPNPLACSPFTSPTVRHRVPSGFNWALLCLLILTREFANDLGSLLLCRKPTAPCQCPDFLRLDIHWAEVQPSFERVSEYSYFL